MNILVTGASGNIGFELIRHLFELKTEHTIIAADYKIPDRNSLFKGFPSLQYRKLDFSDPQSFESALEDIDIVFLLRPPQLADVPRFFEPFIAAMKKQQIKNIMFLSVQGVENQKMIPHYKLEQLIIENELDYVFLQPGYFMQNLTTTLIHEIKHENRIYIPAGKLKLNWVDAADIGKVGAHILVDFERYINRSYEITGSEFLGFDEIVQKLTNILDRKISYKSPNLISFYMAKRRLGVAPAMIFVMIMLHFLPRFGKNEARLTETVIKITGDQPGTLDDFIEREKAKF